MAATACPIQVEDAPKTDAYRLIVFNRAGTAVLLEASSSGHDLPLVEIPKFTRSAEKITTYLRDHWRIPTVLLFSGLLEQTPDPLYFAALEAQVRTCGLPEGMYWFPIHHAISHLLNEQERKVLESAYFKSTDRMPGIDPEPFTRLGWLSNLQDWVRSVIQPLGMELRDFRQLNGCETFSLIRFDTTQAPVWFKCVGKPNLHEFPITVALAKLFPQYLPSVLAPHPHYRGWLMADSGDTSLAESQDASAWASPAAALADLQNQSATKSADLLQAGCRDLRIPNLLELVDPYLDAIADLMQQQTKVPPPILSREELADLSARLKDSLLRLESLRFPDTLGHSDFNPGNIFVGPEGCTFIDWAEAHVSHPFLTFEYLISHLRKDHPALGQLEGAIRSRYSQCWQSLFSSEKVSEAFLYTPLVAVFAYAVAGNAWRDVERLKIPHVPGYLRSLTRRMKQEADLVQRRRVECRN
jgi:hypothetical protein